LSRIFNNYSGIDIEMHAREAMKSRIEQTHYRFKTRDVTKPVPLMKGKIKGREIIENTPIEKNKKVANYEIVGSLPYGNIFSYLAMHGKKIISREDLDNPVLERRDETGNYRLCDLFEFEIKSDSQFEIDRQCAVFLNDVMPFVSSYVFDLTPLLVRSKRKSVNKVSYELLLPEFLK
jgi:hypothetical protein